MSKLMLKFVSSMFLVIGILGVTNSIPAQAKDNANTYYNSTYQYYSTYPAKVFIDTTASNTTYTDRGANNTLIGGDTVWSNYNQPTQYTVDTMPSDLKLVTLMIYKVDTNTTYQQFLRDQGYTVSRIKNKPLGATNAKLVLTREQDGQQSSLYLIKDAERMFVFSAAHDGNGSAGLLRQISRGISLQ